MYVNYMYLKYFLKCITAVVQACAAMSKHAGH